MPTVNYNGKTISDAKVKEVLSKIASNIGTVNVTSGDRNHVPKGGSKKSHHLQHRAADFYISGMTLTEAFKKLGSQKTKLFGLGSKYQIIHHGKNTETGGPHLHIGRYSSGTGTTFLEEGTSSSPKGKYTIVGY